MEELEEYFHLPEIWNSFIKGKMLFFAVTTFTYWMIKVRALCMDVEFRPIHQIQMKLVDSYVRNTEDQSSSHV